MIYEYIPDVLCFTSIVSVFLSLCTGKTGIRKRTPAYHIVKNTLHPQHECKLTDCSCLLFFELTNQLYKRLVPLRDHICILLVCYSLNLSSFLEIFRSSDGLSKHRFRKVFRTCTKPIIQLCIKICCIYFIMMWNALYMYKQILSFMTESDILQYLHS